MPALDRYHAKRDFSRTKEPRGAAPSQAAGDAEGGLFVVHKHAARRLHYDLRLEHGGVLWSWAVTRGPSLDPDEKRLAVHVEDHPLEYGAFEGTIPEGEYGAGSVIVWDEGRWVPEGDPAAAMAKGHLSFILEGHKLAGQWHLVRLKPRRGETRDNWLLIKVDDAAARTDDDILDSQPNSVKSGLSVEAVGRDEAPEAKVWAKTKRRGGSAPPKAAARRTKRSTGKGSRVGGSGRAQALPDFVPPCLATLQDKAPAGEDWLHEVKFDGYRLQARIAKGAVKLLTRTGLDWTSRFGSALPKVLAALPCETALIDGEVVVMGENGVSSFSALQQVLTGERKGALVFFAFDLLHLDGEDLTSEPLLARKERLQALLGAGSDGPLRYSEHFREAGETMLSHACRLGLEGVVSKRADAAYRSGRNGDWIKSKCVQRQEFVIAGYVPSKGSGRELGALVAGYREAGALRPAGRIGTGFTRKSAADLKARLDAIKAERSPFSDRAAAREKGIVWVEPEMVAEVAFRSWTASGLIRHASFVGLREDKPPEEVVLERPVATHPAERRSSRAGASEPKAQTAIRLSNPDKPLWPDVGLTKQGLLDYYARVWPLMAPFVCNRPLSLLRAPDGIEGGQRFFQKHASPGMHAAIGKRRDVDGEDLLFIRDFDGLAALVQLGTVEIHVWGAAIETVETPDQLIFDLDPDEGVPVEAVREGAQAVRHHLAELGFESLLKISGGKGFHVVVPLQPKADWTRVKDFARDFAKALEQSEPKRYTATLSKKARRGRIFIDYLRNGRGATAIAPFSTRARPGATIALPVEWDGLAEQQPNAASAMHKDLAEKLPAGWPQFFETKQSL